MPFKTSEEFFDSVRDIEGISEKLDRLDESVLSGKFDSAGVVADTYAKLMGYTEEFISVPVADIFEDMSFLDLGVDEGIFYEYAESMVEIPMISLRYRENQVQATLDKLHRLRSPDERRKLAYYAVRWKIKSTLAATYVNEIELNEPFIEPELTELRHEVRELRSLGYDLPKGEFYDNVPVKLDGFTEGAARRLADENVTTGAAQAWVDSSAIMFVHLQTKRSTYVPYDSSVAVEVDGTRVCAIFPESRYGEGAKRLMQRIKIINRRRM